MVNKIGLISHTVFFKQINKGFAVFVVNIGGLNEIDPKGYWNELQNAGDLKTISDKNERLNLFPGKISMLIATPLLSLFLFQTT